MVPGRDDDRRDQAGNRRAEQQSYATASAFDGRYRDYSSFFSGRKEARRRAAPCCSLSYADPPPFRCDHSADLDPAPHPTFRKFGELTRGHQHRRPNRVRLDMCLRCVYTFLYREQVSNLIHHSKTLRR